MMNLDDQVSDHCMYILEWEKIHTNKWTRLNKKIRSRLQWILNRKKSCQLNNFPIFKLIVLTESNVNSLQPNYLAIENTVWTCESENSQAILSNPSSRHLSNKAENSSERVVREVKASLIGYWEPQLSTCKVIHTACSLGYLLIRMSRRFIVKWWMESSGTF